LNSKRIPAVKLWKLVETPGDRYRRELIAQHRRIATAVASSPGNPALPYQGKNSAQRRIAAQSVVWNVNRYS